MQNEDITFSVKLVATGGASETAVGLMNAIVKAQLEVAEKILASVGIKLPVPLLEAGHSSEVSKDPLSQDFVYAWKTSISAKALNDDGPLHSN